MKQLVEIPGTTPPERYQTLVVNVNKEFIKGERRVYRNREFVSFNRVAIYPEYACGGAAATPCAASPPPRCGRAVAAGGRSARCSWRRTGPCSAWTAD
eukprot:g29326.t1